MWHPDLNQFPLPTAVAGGNGVLEHHYSNTSVVKSEYIDKRDAIKTHMLWDVYELVSYPVYTSFDSFLYVIY